MEQLRRRRSIFARKLQATAFHGRFLSVWDLVASLPRNKEVQTNVSCCVLNRGDKTLIDRINKLVFNSVHTFALSLTCAPLIKHDVIGVPDKCFPSLNTFARADA